MEYGIENLGVAAIVVLLILDKLKGLVPKYIYNGKPQASNGKVYVREELNETLGRMFEHIEKQNEVLNKFLTGMDKTLADHNDAMKEIVSIQYKTNQMLKEII